MRPSADRTWLDVAAVIARRSTCLRRAVGCVLIGVHGDVIGAGFNGVAPGQPHCNEALFRPTHASLVERPPHSCDVALGGAVEYANACPGARAPSGTALDACRALHAEANALVSCRTPFEVDVCYLTVSPCVPCAKLLLRTPCRRVVFSEEYVNTDARALWEGAGREWRLMPP